MGRPIFMAMGMIGPSNMPGISLNLLLMGFSLIRITNLPQGRSVTIVRLYHIVKETQYLILLADEVGGSIVFDVGFLV